MSPHCDRNFEDRKQVILHDTQTYDDASLCQGCLQQVQPFTRYHRDPPDEHLLKLLPLL